MKVSAIGILSVLLVTLSCSGGGKAECERNLTEAKFFRISEDGGLTIVESISPYDSHIDTLVVDKAFEKFVCMSSTQVAGLVALGADDMIYGVSGMDYITSPLPSHVKEVGYDASLDLETIVGMNPDVVFSYYTSAVRPDCFERLESFGVRVFPVYEHMEMNPVARASYLRLYGAVSGKLDEANRLYDEISGNYEAVRDSVRKRIENGGRRIPVLLNTPYSDAWFVPNTGSYMSCLVSDAGGYVLGSKEGVGSSVLSFEEVFSLAGKAEKWLNVTGFNTLEDLHFGVRLSERFPFDEGDVFALKANPGGGLDFYESGAVRPDIVLRDLVSILSCDRPSADSLTYYQQLRK